MPLEYGSLRHTGAQLSAVCAPDTCLAIVSDLPPHAQVVRILLEHGADANMDNRAPLTAAITAKNAAVVELLVGGVCDCACVCDFVCVCVLCVCYVCVWMGLGLP